MNYNKHYNQLIERAKNRTLIGYSEIHHVVPRCMGGTDDSTNLVALTPSEHFICHLLLARIYPEIDGLVIAAFLMSGKAKYSNKEYARLREQYAAIKSQQTVGSGNSMYGRNHTEQVKQTISKANKGRVRTPEHREAISKTHRGKKLTDETKQKISQAHKGKVVSEETRQRLSKAHKGKPQNPESGRKRSVTISGSGNHRYGKGSEVSGANNPMYGRRWFVNAKGEKALMLPTDERLQQEEWRKGKVW